MIDFLTTPSLPGALLCLMAAGGLWIRSGYRVWLEMYEGEI